MTTKKRSRNSIYYLTINSQIPFVDGDEEKIQKAKLFRDVVENIFSEENLFDIVNFPGAENRDDEIAKIPEVVIHSAIEVQGNAAKNFIHGHVLVGFRRHRTKLSLNYGKIRQIIKEKMGLSYTPFVSSQLIRNLQTFEDLFEKIKIYGEKFTNSIN